MAAVALILRDMTPTDYNRLCQEGLETKLKDIGSDVYFTYNYIFSDIRRYIPGRTRLFENVDANHIVHDCGRDIDLFLWGCENPLSFYRWQYQERGYNDPKTRKENLKNDFFKQEHDMFNDIRKRKWEENKKKRIELKM